LSGRGLCDELITRPEESNRLCCVVVCDLETSRMGAPYIYNISRLRVNIALEYVIKQLSVQTTLTILYKLVQLTGYVDDINIIGIRKKALSEAYGELKERAKEVGLIINVEKAKAIVQSRRLGKGRTLIIEDHKIEVVRRFKYLGTVTNDVNDETEEIRARVLAANKAYSSLQTIFRSKQIRRNNKIRLYKTLIKPILRYGSVTWTLTKTSEQMLTRLKGKYWE